MTNDAANPFFGSENQCGVVQVTTSETGLTKLEYFSSMVLQGLSSNPHMVQEYKMEYIAGLAVKQARVLIEELNKI